MPTPWSPPFPARHDACPEEVDVVVVGAGLTGLTTAVLLAGSGRSVAVLEARRIGDVTTGHTTGKVSLLQGTKLSRMRRTQSDRVVRAYLEANTEAMAWLLDYCDQKAVPVQVRDAVTFAATAAERDTARAEHEAARRLGLETSWEERPDLGFETHGATVLRDQAQVNPLPLLAALAGELTAHGGVLREGDRVTSVSKVGRPQVRTAGGLRVDCEDVVLATGSPVLDRGLYFAKLVANRSYVLMYDDTEIPPAMLLSSGSPGFSVREVVDEGGSHLMVGGNGHVVGRPTAKSSELGHLDGLRAWAAERFPGGTETHAWSAQDYSSHDGIPFVGALPRGLGHLYVATGYDKWGLTNAVAAARRISGEIVGDVPAWAGPLGHRLTRPSGALAMVTRNLEVGLALTRGIAGAGLRSAEDHPAEGRGSVGRSGVLPVGTSTVEGRTCRVSGLCTHLGGVLEWNDAERSWDCPLHGSRFDPDGRVLEGPATRDLPARPQ